MLGWEKITVPMGILRENTFPVKPDPEEKESRALEDEDGPHVARCRQGDTEAFALLVRRHQKSMLNLAFRMIGDYEEAGDVVQEAFFSAYRSIQKFRGESRFSTWLCAIVLNHSRNHLKQRAIRQDREELSLDDPGKTMNGNSGILSCPSEVEDKLEKRDWEARIRKCLGVMEGDQREVLILRDIQGFSYETIGLTLKLPPGTVRSRLFRGRNALKDCLLKVREGLR
jgi:RNA polymerase sigma-70 factor, ECF subfamily